MIYEFTGIPASGKTTLISQIKYKKNITDLSYKYKINYFGKFFFRIYLHCPIVLIGYSKLFNNIKSYFNFGKKNIFNDKISITLYIKFLIYVINLEKKYSKKSGVFLLDEGIIHYLVALEVEFGVEHSKMIELLIEIKKEIEFKTIFYQCDINVAFSRFIQRNRHQTSIDDLNEKEIVNLLKLYDECIKTYSEYYVVYDENIILKEN